MSVYARLKSEYEQAKLEAASNGASLDEETKRKAEQRAQLLAASDAIHDALEPEADLLSEDGRETKVSSALIATTDTALVSVVITDPKSGQLGRTLAVFPTKYDLQFVLLSPRQWQVRAERTGSDRVLSELFQPLTVQVKDGELESKVAEIFEKFLRATDIFKLPR